MRENLTGYGIYLLILTEKSSHSVRIINKQRCPINKIEEELDEVAQNYLTTKNTPKRVKTFVIDLTKRNTKEAYNKQKI